MKRAEKILFGERVASTIKDFDYGVVLTQEGVSAKRNNEFRKFIKKFGAVTSGGNMVMAKALENTDFSELYTGSRGSLIAIFFDDKDAINVLSEVRRKFKYFKIVSGLSHKSKLSTEILQNLAKNKNDAQFYLELKKALVAPFKCLVSVLQKLQEKSEASEADSHCEAELEKIDQLLEEVTLLGIYKVCYKILERIK